MRNAHLASERLARGKHQGRNVQQVDARLLLGEKILAAACGDRRRHWRVHARRLRVPVELHRHAIHALGCRGLAITVGIEEHQVTHAHPAIEAKVDRVIVVVITPCKQVVIRAAEASFGA